MSDVSTVAERGSPVARWSVVCRKPAPNGLSGGICNKWWSNFRLLADEINEYFANRNKLLTFANYCASLCGSGATLEGQVYSVVKNTAVNSRNFSIFEVLEYLGGIELLSKFVSCLNASQTASERSYCAILRSFDSGRTVIFWFLECDAFAWKAEKSSSNLEKNTKKREG